ncbi:MAG: hypothetical protein ACI8ZB_002827 [Desulforhopalus sp.]|jgi:hypothetical protein
MNIVQIDNWQEICDLETYNIQPPTDEDVAKFLSIGKRIQKMLHPYNPLTAKG